jgi:bacteriocin-like protein
MSDETQDKPEVARASNEMSTDELDKVSGGQDQVQDPAQMFQAILQQLTQEGASSPAPTPTPAPKPKTRA